MSKNWKPLLDRLLVKQDPAPHLHPNSGLTIPDSQREDFRPHTGLVVAVGPGVYQNGVLCPVNLKEGEHVMFANPDTLTKVEHAGAEHLMMMERDVFLVLDKPATEKENKKAEQFQVISSYHIVGERYITVLAAPLTSQASRIPAVNERYQTYAGTTCRVTERTAKALHMEPERPSQFDKLRQELTHHQVNNIPLAFIGPKL